MKLDITTKEALIMLQKKVKEKFDLDLSIQEIGTIYESQFQAGALGFKKRVTVRLPYIGVFVDKERKRKHEKFLELENLKPFISNAEYKEKLLKVQLEEKALMTKAKSETVFATVEDLKKIPNVVNVFNVFDEVL